MAKASIARSLIHKNNKHWGIHQPHIYFHPSWILKLVHWEGGKRTVTTKYEEKKPPIIIYYWKELLYKPLSVHKVLSTDRKKNRYSSVDLLKFLWNKHGNMNERNTAKEHIPRNFSPATVEVTPTYLPLILKKTVSQKLLSLSSPPTWDKIGWEVVSAMCFLGVWNNIKSDRFFKL